jgi:hypothetical protein
MKQILRGLFHFPISYLLSILRFDSLNSLFEIIVQVTFPFSLTTKANHGIFVQQHNLTTLRDLFIIVKFNHLVIQ